MVRPTSVGDEKILSFEDVVLRRSDLDILSGPEFLNDRIIEFYFSYLTYSDSSKTKLFLSPAISFWMVQCPDVQSIRDVLESLKLSSYSVIVFPVNDNDDVSRAEGGTHWSLLAYHKKSRMFLHHDSCRHLNRDHALKLFRRVSLFLDDSDSLTFEEADTPEQVNSYDCGVYVLAIAKIISSWKERIKETDMVVPWAFDLEKNVTSAKVTKLRRDILELIASMMD